MELDKLGAESGEGNILGRDGVLVYGSRHHTICKCYLGPTSSRGVRSPQAELLGSCVVPRALPGVLQGDAIDATKTTEVKNDVSAALSEPVVVGTGVAVDRLCEHAGGGVHAVVLARGVGGHRRADAGVVVSQA